MNTIGVVVQKKSHAVLVKEIATMTTTALGVLCVKLIIARRFGQDPGALKIAVFHPTSMMVNSCFILLTP